MYSYFSKNAIEERIVAIMKTNKIGVIPTIAALALMLSVTCGFTTSAVADEKNDAEASTVDVAIPTNANNEGNEQKQFLHYVFDDEAIRGVSEDEFQSVLESNSEQCMLYYFVHDDIIYEMSKTQFNEVVEKII